MKAPKTAVLVAILSTAAGWTGYWYGMKQAPHAAPAAAPAAEANVDAQGRKILYWQDPMYPQHRFDKPGKSPFMNMDLVPVYADAAGEEGGVAVSARMRQTLGVRTAEAEQTVLKQDIRAVGYVQPDERRIARAEARFTGWVEKLHVRAVNDPVRAGQALAEIYSPELFAAQDEYLLARRMAQANPADEPIARAARKRLELLGFPSGLFAEIEKTGTARRRIPLIAPISGVLSELGVREGTMIQAGMPAFTLTDLSSVWITVEVPESQGALLRQGVRAEARMQTVPGKVFQGRIDYIYPELKTETRTLRARITVPNPGMVLKPGMFTDVALVASERKTLTVPSEAVIQTGTRTVVVVAEGERFRPATVKVGAETAGHTEILSGLKQGERVVVSGQFLIDSEASLRSTLTRLEGAGHVGRGKVTDLHIAKGRIELDHEAIPSLKWPGMTMEFLVEDKSALRTLKRGDAVEFEVRAEPTKDGDYVIEKIRKGSS
jgi:Cu(I)/Ag(I) efflux system membrane fusion protein